MTYRSILGVAAIVSVALISTVVLAGCESGVDPYVGTEEPYTIWGVFDAAADTQKVRVFSIEGEPGIDRPSAVDASVVSTNLSTGDRVEWTPRTVTYEEGETGHVFWAPFRAQSGHRYRLDVTRSDGNTSTAEVTVPTGVELEINTSDTRSTLPVRIVGDVPNLLGVEVRYEATNMPPDLVWPPGTVAHPLVFHPVDISYQEELNRIEGGWQFNIQMQRDYDLVRREFERNCLVTNGAPGIALRRVELRLVAADSTWSPPGGAFDPEVLVEPTAMSNIDNGFGFIGAGHVKRLRWTPPRETRLGLGYSESRPCGMDAQPIPACMEPPIPCLGENPLDIWELFF
ncbi:MAG: hypothetical protein WD423_15400 [Rhodothermales bacterium]